MTEARGSIAHSEAPSPAMIEVEGLVKAFGVTRAVDGISFNVGKGEILGFLGPNGAGKTTTMRILTGYTPATSGHVRVGGFDTVGQSMAARRITGYLPESAPLYTDMIVKSYLKFMAEVKGIAASRRRGAVDESLDECGLGDVAGRMIGNLSKGYRQRVGLAQALLGDPQVLVLDEPTVGLDPRQIAEIRQLIRSMAGRRTVILSTHILPEVSMTCQKVIIIANGRIQAQGTPEHLVSTLGGGSMITVKVAGPESAVLELLGKVTGVLAVNVVRQAGDHIVYRIETDKSQDSRAEISRALVSAGHGLLGMGSEGLSLEDIFLRVISGEAVQNEEVA